MNFRIYGNDLDIDTFSWDELEDYEKLKEELDHIIAKYMINSKKQYNNFYVDKLNLIDMVIHNHNDSVYETMNAYKNGEDIFSKIN